MALEPLNTQDQWIAGEKYLLAFRAPTWFGAALTTRSQIDAVVSRVSADSRLRIDSWSWDGKLLSFNVTAIENPLPIGLIVGGIIGIALLYGLALTLDKVARIVEGGGPVLTGGIGALFVAGAIVLVVAVLK